MLILERIIHLPSTQNQEVLFTLSLPSGTKVPSPSPGTHSCHELTLSPMTPLIVPWTGQSTIENPGASRLTFRPCHQHSQGASWQLLPGGLTD